MPSFRRRKDVVVHALYPQLYRFHGVAGEDVKYFPADIVRTCREPYSGHSAVADEILRRVKQANHQPPVDPGKAAAEKRDLRIAVGNRRKCSFYSVLYRTLVKAPLSGNASLIAENAVVRAAEMRYEHRDVDVSLSGSHSPKSARASLAAFCSAARFDRPFPVPITLPFSRASTVKTFICAGPRSPTVTYSRMSPCSFCTTC
ncbi:unknown [Candidatus Colimorpha enterica]|uniref:Uncharacterized protein n=1 Tax=Candidatus Colimorpha enterica TaxID=3083063 RepID=R6TMB1_9BACT|nr:unknown [Candidatus Colimorpha enterica]